VTLSLESTTVLTPSLRTINSAFPVVESLSQDLLTLPSFDWFYAELHTSVLSSVVLSFCRQKNYTIRSFQVKLKTTNLTLALAIKSFANYLFDTDSLISIRCFISTAKTSLFLSSSFTLVGLSTAPLSFINHGKFDLITTITQEIDIQETKIQRTDLGGQANS
jgi:hypothetical protein